MCVGIFVAATCQRCYLLVVAYWWGRDRRGSTSVTPCIRRGRLCPYIINYATLKLRHKDSNPQQAVTFTLPKS
ncbi:hypothetical protein KKE26_00130, partial [bacterium]|nr:hypothetical protein [bacterium]